MWKSGFLTCGYYYTRVQGKEIVAAELIRVFKDFETRAEAEYAKKMKETGEKPEKSEVIRTADAYHTLCVRRLSDRKQTAGLTFAPKRDNMILFKIKK